MCCPHDRLLQSRLSATLLAMALCLCLCECRLALSLSLSCNTVAEGPGGHPQRVLGHLLPRSRTSPPKQFAKRSSAAAKAVRGHEILRTCQQSLSAGSILTISRRTVGLDILHRTSDQPELSAKSSSSRGAEFSARHELCCELSLRLESSGLPLARRAGSGGHTCSSVPG